MLSIVACTSLLWLIQHQQQRKWSAGLTGSARGHKNTDLFLSNLFSNFLFRTSSLFSVFYLPLHSRPTLSHFSHLVVSPSTPVAHNPRCRRWSQSWELDSDFSFLLMATGREIFLRDTYQKQKTTEPLLQSHTPYNTNNLNSLFSTVEHFFSNFCVPLTNLRATRKIPTFLKYLHFCY